MRAQQTGGNSIGFRSGMHTSCAAIAETALALQLAPARQAAASEHDLARREMLMLPATCRQLIVLAGEIWLTRDGDAEDYILRPGQRLALGREDRAAVQALQASRFRLSFG
ncbi:MAG: DUF2917 domain-containing protein [Sulfuritalea sp.]|nr:DUF2917 domain-containing protein [Sulfuritalea sp.]MDP1982357.1 DUF2917 domain-containing protein [Sulfuritalea sp.]